jgi:hypothetical protein
MWWLMAQAIKKGQVALPSGDTVLRSELTAPDFKFKVRQRRTLGCLETKDEMAKRGIGSPDRGDALALSFAAPLVRRLRDSNEEQLLHRQGRRSGRVVSDWDPLDQERS